MPMQSFEKGWTLEKLTRLPKQLVELLFLPITFGSRVELFIELFGTNPSMSIELRTRARVSSETWPGLFKTLETVPTETCACFATSRTFGLLTLTTYPFNFSKNKIFLISC